MKFRVTARHIVYATYEVEADHWQEAADKLAETSDLFSSRTPTVFQFQPEVIRGVDGIVLDVESIDYDSSPSASGRLQHYRDWEVWQVEGEE